jgi:hypothetical protein
MKQHGTDSLKCGVLSKSSIGAFFEESINRFHTKRKHRLFIITNVAAALNLEIA